MHLSQFGLNVLFTQFLCLRTSTEVEDVKKKLDEYIHQVEILRKEFKEIKVELEGSKHTMDSVCELITEVLTTLPSNSK